MLQVHSTHNIIVVPGGVGVTGTQHSQHHCGTRRSGCYRYTALITSLWYQEEWVLQVGSVTFFIRSLFIRNKIYTVTKFIRSVLYGHFSYSNKIYVVNFCTHPVRTKTHTAHYLTP